MLKMLAIYVWLLTCAPGEQLYEQYGHTALRVMDTEQGLDLCFNYGTFSFNTEHFYYKFVKGETYYMLTYEPTEMFMYEYIVDKRPVYAQKLNLTESEKKCLITSLMTGSRPKNRNYLYNFVEDNCCTRPFRLLQQITGDSIRSPYAGNEGNTYRRFIEHYTRPHTVINALINMIFGRRSDRPMYGESRLFLPEELMLYMDQATFADGTPVVLQSNAEPFVIKPVQWWESVYLYLCLFAIALAVLSWYDRKRGKLTIAVDIVLGIVYLCLIAITIFLTFFSIHPLVGFNWRLLVLPSLHLCARLIYILR